jgi:AraC family carnitine catabolism transcriptional activator
MGWHGHAGVAEEVAEHLLVERVRSGAAAQRAAVQPATDSPDDTIARTQALMAQHIEEPLSCAALAQHAGLSLRQLERRYRSEMGSSVLHQYRMIRIGQAHQLLQQTALPVTEVALSCGFRSPEYFCRLYRSMLGVSPSADRKQSTTAPVLRRRRRLTGTPRT